MTELRDPSLTRRGFLGASAAVLGVSALPSPVLGQRAPYRPGQRARYRRYEISDPYMPSRVLTSYKKAIREMLKRPPTDPRNWYRNAFVHVFDCPHGNWWFLAWHRAYLGWFERICRQLAADRDFALPYWDWTKTPRVPPALFEDVLDPNHAAFVASFPTFKQQFEVPVGALWARFSQAQKNVLAQRGLNSAADFWDVAEQMFFDQPNARGLTAATPDLDPFTQGTVAIGVIRSALRTPTFAGSADGSDPAGFSSAKAANHNEFRPQGILESQPHNNVHGAMGGQAGLAFMVSFLSPVDPIFFLHHANLDRLWDVWTRRQAALQRPTLPEGADLATWSDERFLFFSQENGQAVAKTKAGEYTTMRVFDYDYTPGSGEDEVPAVVAAAAPLPLATQRFSARMRAGGAGEAAGGVVEVPGALLRAAAPDAAPPVLEVTLQLEHGDEGRRFRVQLALPGGGTPIEAGAITVFGHPTGPTTFTVPLPAHVSAPLEANVPLDIRVVPLEVAGAAPPPAERRPVRRGGAAAPQVTAIQVRV